MDKQNFESNGLNEIKVVYKKYVFGSRFRN